MSDHATAVKRRRRLLDQLLDADAEEADLLIWKIEELYRPLYEENEKLRAALRKIAKAPHDALPATLSEASDYAARVLHQVGDDGR